MSTFTATAGMMPEAPPDPTKHVKYNVGMVLGVDDFNQEFAYLLGRDQWMARDLIGYGTVSGLQVSVEDDVAKGPRVKVEPGVALSPRGQLIRVPTAQCAYLNEWLKLDATKKELKIGSPLSALKLYVVLCYRECPTEKVPIPGEPCRSEDDIMLPSRLVDDFRLELALKPPGQREEDAVRDFVEWLRQIEVSDTIPSTPLKEFLDAISSGAHVLASPPRSGPGPLPDYMFGSPPAWFVINRSDLCDYLHAAFRLWVTELRPKWRPDFFGSECGCSDKKPVSTGEVEECLLLAELDLPVSVPNGGTDWQVQNAAVIGKDEKRRPIVVHLRMLQEMLLCGQQEHVLDAITSPPSTVAVNDHGALTGLNDDDHPHYLLVNPVTRSLVVDLNASGRRVTNLSPGASAGDAVVFQQAIKQNDPAGGDLSGTYPNPSVSGLRSRPLSSTTPTTTNQVLTWNQGINQWEPKHHSLDDLNDVAAPSPADGQVLAFRSSQWHAEPPGALDVVEHPAGLPRYSIVAAGIVRCTGRPGALPPVYNGLFATATNTSEVTVTFDTYESQSPTFQYIVKVLPLFNDALRTVWVSFGMFLPAPDGFQLRVERFDPANPRDTTIPRDALQQLELMIEVSRFEARR